MRLSRSAAVGAEAPAVGSWAWLSPALSQQTGNRASRVSDAFRDSEKTPIRHPSWVLRSTIRHPGLDQDADRFTFPPDSPFYRQRQPFPPTNVLPNPLLRQVRKSPSLVHSPRALTSRATQPPLRQEVGRLAQRDEQPHLCLVIAHR